MHGGCICGSDRYRPTCCSYDGAMGGSHQKKKSDDSIDDMKTLAEQHLQSKTAMSFFCISGAQDEAGKFAFRSTKHTFITAAVGTKADRMKEATELHNLLAVSRSWNRAAGLVLQRCLLS